MPDRLDLTLPDCFDGLLILGDVHGHVERFARLIALARKRKLFVVSLGDLVNRGPDSAGCLRLMRKAMIKGRGLFLRGNHEDKLYRTLSGDAALPCSSIARTIEELGKAPDGSRLRKWFLDHFDTSPFVITYENLLLTHGGYSPPMLEGPDEFSEATRTRALYGKLEEQHNSDSRPIRLYDWVEEIPRGNTVVMGHDPISSEQLLERRVDGERRLIHLDSGAGREGPLSALIVRRDGKIAKAIQLSPNRKTIRATGFERLS